MRKQFRKPFKFFALSLILTGLIASCGGDSGNGPASSGKLGVIKDRGVLKCGVSGKLPGFSFVKPDGDYAGLDVDFCRAIAAAIFDDPSKVEYTPLSAEQRFEAVASGEVDILSRNTTATLSRDRANKLAFAPVVFYDGQGMMVRKDSGIKKLIDLKNKAICTQTGTTTERNLTDQMRKLNVPFEPKVFGDIDQAYATYAAGGCEGVTSDRSQLLSRRSQLQEPDAHEILGEVMSKEPLAPAVSDGDDQWADLVTWVIYATMEAEELGITSQNLSQYANSSDPVVARFMGDEDSLGEALGLEKDFAAKVIKHVGNYQEIYDRNLGPNTPLKLERGQNQLWSKGGLLYPLPFR